MPAPLDLDASAGGPSSESVDRWLVEPFSRSLASLSSHTVSAYASDVRGFADWVARLGADDPSAVTRTTVRRYLAHLTTRQYARRSIARKAAALRRYFRWLVRTGRIPTDPTTGVQAKGGDGRLPRVLDRRDLDELLSGPAARGRAGVAPPPRRRRARGAVRLRAAGQRAVRAGHDVDRARPGRGRRVGQGSQGATGPAVRPGRRRAAVVGWRCGPTCWRRTRRRCSATSAGDA